MSGYGPMIFANRLVRTRTPVVWGLGAKHPRLPDYAAQQRIHFSTHESRGGLQLLARQMSDVQCCIGSRS